MAVTTSRTVADVGVQDGVGIAQSDTQQVSFCFLQNVPYCLTTQKYLKPVDLETLPSDQPAPQKQSLLQFLVAGF